MKQLLPLISLVPVVAMAVTALTAAPGSQTFTGTLTDSVCSNAVHSQMRMGPTDAECAQACVGAHDADYVLYDGKKAHVLSQHPMLEQFAGKKVTVTGSQDAKTGTIQVDSITAAK
jgi:hypothetical protein